MTGELGSDWMQKYKEFDLKPFAAASIGQVHRAVLLDGTQVTLDYSTGYYYLYVTPVLYILK